MNNLSFFQRRLPALLFLFATASVVRAITLTSPTAQTGQPILTAVTAWQAGGVEHLAGMAPNGDLIVFFRSPGQSWNKVNVSAITGQKIVGEVSAWQVPDGPLIVEHLAARNLSGEVINFFWSPAHDWQAINVSQITGQAVATPLSSWQSRDGPYIVENIAGTNGNGDVLVFFWYPAHDWQVANVSKLSGQQVKGPVTNWQALPDYSTTFAITENLAGISPGGEVVVFSWQPSRDWKGVTVAVTNISRPDRSTRRNFSGAIAAWQTVVGDTDVQRLAAIADGELFVFSRPGYAAWQVVNLTGVTGQKANYSVTSWQSTGTPALDALNTGGPAGSPPNWEYLAASNSNGDIVVFGFPSGDPSQARTANLATLTSYKFSSVPVSWQTPSGIYNAEHLAAVTNDQNVIELSWTGQQYSARIHVVQIANDGGTNVVQLNPLQFKRWVDQANIVYVPGSILVQFDPSSNSGDWSYMNSTFLNGLVDKDSDPMWTTRTAAANAVAAHYPGSVTVLARYGPGPGPTGLSFSGTDLNFVVMRGYWQNQPCGAVLRSNLAHEVGHYWGLNHTFPKVFHSISEAETFYNGSSSSSPFDGDGVADTPPDPYVEINSIQCDSSVTTLTVAGKVYTLPRTNVMSYYAAASDDLNQTITPDQVKIMKGFIDKQATRY